PRAWVRLSPKTFYDVQRPATAEYPVPHWDGELRALLDSGGRLRLLQSWPDRPAPGDTPLDPLLAAASLHGPLRPVAATPAAFERGEPLLPYLSAEGARLFLARREGTILRFGVEGEDAPPPRSGLVPPMPNAFLLALVAIVVFMAIRNVKGRRADWRGAGVFAAASLAFQILKLVAKPVTFTNGIWFRVVLEAAGFAFLVFLAYLGFEPAVRRRIPAALLGWTRLATAGRADEQVGRELLLGAAALLPFGLLVALLAALGLGGVSLEGRENAIVGLGLPSVRMFELLDGLQVGVFLAAILLLLASPLARGERSFAVTLSVSALFVAALFVPRSSFDLGAVLLVVGTAALLALLVVKGGVLALVTFLGAGRGCLDAVPPALGSWTIPYSAVAPLVAGALAAAGLFLATRRASP
ncbi:MAG TPA: hypothetical protein VGR00_10540, partial [Thermoanaerobaculia bacterium]|nr:hypothetical protein [Thermoanaerobaculia bacterium]